MMDQTIDEVSNKDFRPHALANNSWLHEELVTKINYTCVISLESATLVIDQVFTSQPWITKFPFGLYELGVKGYNCLIGDGGLIVG